MGIPTYFKHIFFKYNDILNNIIEDEIDNFYMDLNCLIHPCSKNKNTDEEVINSVIKTMDIIINNINPKKKIYIAIDGVCPIAKVITQRKRRLKSIINNEFMSAMKEYKYFDEKRGTCLLDEWPEFENYYSLVGQQI